VKHKDLDPDGPDDFSFLSLGQLSRRELLTGSGAFGAAFLAGPVFAPVEGKKIFAIQECVPEKPLHDILSGSCESELTSIMTFRVRVSRLSPSCTRESRG
jgi:hypothetical protein